MPIATIPLEEAKSLAEELFPRGPEEIAEILGVELDYCALTGADGWCVNRKGLPPKIRINKNAARVRRRFTLAHEIAHILLHTDAEIVSQSILPFQSVRKEERKADSLAAELLIPFVHLEKYVQEVPVDAHTIKKLARASKVSHMVAVGRVVAEARRLGLDNGALAVFHEGDLQYCWSPTLKNVRKVAPQLYADAMKVSPKVSRSKVNKSQRVTTAVVVGSPEFPVLLIQLLPSHQVAGNTHHELTRELDEAFFCGDEGFRRKFNGTLGYLKQRMSGLNLDAGVSAYNKRYTERWDSDLSNRLLSKEGQAYLRHRLSAWLPEE